MPEILPLLAAALIALATPPAWAAEVSVTLDDLPYAMPRRTAPQDGAAIVASVNAALARHGVTATGFVIGANVDAASLPALQAFRAAGHSIGNHSWSHPDYTELSPAQFRAETTRADALLAAWMPERKLYRFPYLRQGETPEKRDAAAAVLAELGYVNAPVSIDTDDWRFNADYLAALAIGDRAAADRIARDYLAHIRERSAHFQALAAQLTGREVKHVLLLHMNRINADHLDALLEQYHSDGWQFITLDAALADPVYRAPDLYAGPRGLSQLERLRGGE